MNYPKLAEYTCGLKRAIRALSFTLFAAVPAHAVVIQTEAEDGTLGSQWGIVSVPEALGGEVIAGNDASGGSGAPTVVDQVASYSLNFSEAGEYDLYLRIALASDDSYDAFFMASDFGPAPLSDDTVWDHQNSLSDTEDPKEKLEDMPTVDGPLASTYAAGELFWINASAVFEEDNVPGVATDSDDAVPTFIVDTAGTLIYELANRQGDLELGYQIDALAFGLTSERASVFVNANGALAVGVPGDVNGDEMVTGADFDIIKMNFGNTDVGRIAGDLTRDGIVDFADFREWKNIAPASVVASVLGVPEPSSVLMFIVAVGGACATRWRTGRLSAES